MCYTFIRPVAPQTCEWRITLWCYTATMSLGARKFSVPLQSYGTTTVHVVCRWPKFCYAQLYYFTNPLVLILLFLIFDTWVDFTSIYFKESIILSGWNPNLKFLKQSSSNPGVSTTLYNTFINSGSSGWKIGLVSYIILELMPTK